MAKKTNGSQHSFWVSYNNPMDVEVHRKLIGLNPNIYKSESRYIVECIYKCIQNEGKIQSDDTKQDKKSEFITKEQLDEVGLRLKEDILKELNASLMAIALKLASSNVQNSNIIVNDQEEKLANENVTVINEVQVTDDIDDSVLEVALDYED